MSTAYYFYGNPLYSTRLSQSPYFAETITYSHSGRSANTTLTVGAQCFSAA
ncbi:MAG: hypothetical protein WBV55_21485 [Candidatus Sulfotelmatobacter sp.]